MPGFCTTPLSSQYAMQIWRFYGRNNITNRERADEAAATVA